MAVSDKEMMAMLKGNQMPEQTPPPSEQGAMTAPMGSPMTTPEPQEGNMEQARLNVMMALDMLQNALQEFGMESEEGMALQKVVGDITSQFGERESSTRELMPAEIMNLIQTLPQAGGATPEARAIAQAPIPGTQQPPCQYRSYKWNFSNHGAICRLAVLRTTHSKTGRLLTRLVTQLSAALKTQPKSGLRTR
jgi:hypothetical protein